MGKKFIISAVAFQIFALLGMIVEREYISQTGKVIYLRTAPVDPRDIFRGDYVRLDYTLLTVPKEKTRNLPDEIIKKGQKVYAVLHGSASDIYSLDYLTSVQPKDGVYIAGRIKSGRYRRTNNVINVKYGIEKFFLEQGAGLDLERERGSRSDYQRPMEIKLAVGNSGKSIIQGFRWSPLSMKLTIERQARGREENTDPVSPILKLGIKNASERPVSILKFGDYCAFQLVTDVRRPSGSVLLNQFDCMGLQPSASDVITLAPGEEFISRINLNHSRWHVQKGGKKDHISEFRDREMYRINYDTQGFNELQKLNPNLWLGKLPSRAFTGNGRID